MIHEKEAIQETGLSKRQRVTAVRVAKMKEGEPKYSPSRINTQARWRSEIHTESQMQLVTLLVHRGGIIPHCGISQPKFFFVELMYTLRCTVPARRIHDR